MHTRILQVLGPLLTLLFSFPAQAQSSPDLRPRTEHMGSDAFQDLSPRSQRAWQKHLQASQSSPLQPGCSPYYLAPKVQAPERPKGSVILLHGFTACAQQNDLLAPLLAQNGYHVFVPRLPGHGLPATRQGETWTDNLSEMPRQEDDQRYAEFANSLAEWVRDQEGIKAIAGVSLGGSIAASAVIQNPNVFDRAIIMTPLFDVVQPQNLLVPPLAALMPDWRLHWGAICDQERSKNRGGYCQFGLSHLRAMQQFGWNTLEQLPDLGARVQLVGVEGDDAASNAAILKAAQRLPFAQTCLYQRGSSHSMLSPYDNQHQSKFWLPTLLAQMQRFIASGEYFDQVGPSEEQGFQRCLSHAPPS